MDLIERLTLEAAQADTMLAREHRHRYEFAARLCAGLSLVDLCCGAGYGSAILAPHVSRVLGVDNHAATIETARCTVASEHADASFEVADAVSFLRRLPIDSVEAIVCFEGLEHLHQLDQALALLREQAEHGVKLILSVPNSKMFAEQNPFHVTDFGYDEALQAFTSFPEVSMVPQYLAEGSLICPPGAQDSELSVRLEDRDEPEYANHFIFCVNFAPASVQRAFDGSIQLTAAPLFNRWSEGMKHALESLRRENSRLARGRLGKSGSAAASALQSIAAREAEVDELEQRCQRAENRVAELEQELRGQVPTPTTTSGLGGATQPFSAELPVRTVTAPLQGAVAASRPGEDPNSWEHRRRRAAEFLIPWIEQTVPLAGATVLEYGCGNAAVSCAFAERVERLVGLDIDADWIERGNRELSQRGLHNVTLELHPTESILDALASHRGEIDVLLLYAVLEHLTVAERIGLLTVAREVVRPGGAIVVSETPNRLVYFDHHTAQMPFFHLLPDELALECHRRSGREDFKAAIQAAGEVDRESALEAIARWGRGVSFHEFEVAFGDLSRHVIASSYDMLLFGERPVHAEEVILARYLDRVRPDLAPAFSRYWLDLILSPSPVQRRQPFLRPWTAETVASPGVGWTRCETLRLRGPSGPLWVELPCPTEQLVVGALAAHERPFSLRVRSEGGLSPAPATIVPGPEQQTLASFGLGAPASSLAIEASDECELVFVGYEA